MNEENIRKLVKQASREATRETLKGLGFAADAPQDMQADLLYLRKIRTGSEFVNLRLKAALIAFLVPTVLYLLWEAFKEVVRG